MAVPRVVDEPELRLVPADEHPRDETTANASISQPVMEDPQVDFESPTKQGRRRPAAGARA